MIARPILLRLSIEEHALLVDALDSHEYWQLSEEEYRNSGYVLGPGADDPDTRKSIKACRRLTERLETARTAAAREHIQTTLRLPRPNSPS